MDDDNGIGGVDDVCGVVNFIQLMEGSLMDGDDLKVILIIMYLVEIISLKDIVFVFVQFDILELDFE